MVKAAADVAQQPLPGETQNIVGSDVFFQYSKSPSPRGCCIGLSGAYRSSLPKSGVSVEALRVALLKRGYFQKKKGVLCYPYHSASANTPLPVSPSGRKPSFLAVWKVTLAKKSLLYLHLHRHTARPRRRSQPPTLRSSCCRLG